jgi:hypothetical protein
VYTRSSGARRGNLQGNGFLKEFFNDGLAKIASKMA